jgi:ADP-ribose pyrophosphatase YjhB (NUDIX family)
MSTDLLSQIEAIGEFRVAVMLVVIRYYHGQPQILLVRKKDRGWHIIGGKTEIFEHPAIGGLREGVQEAQVRLRVVGLLDVSSYCQKKSLRRPVYYQMIWFRAEPLDEAEEPQPDNEISGAAYFDLDKMWTAYDPQLAERLPVSVCTYLQQLHQAAVP